MNPLSPQNLTATLLTSIICGGVITLAVFVLLTAGDDGGMHWPPRWPARYPAGPRRGIYGDVCARAVALVIAVAVACGPVAEQEWDAACRRAGWEPGDEGEQVRT